MATKNPSDLADAPDIVSLIYSEEDDVIENLRLRHKKNRVYTAISHIMLAVNPYQTCQIYGSQIIKNAYDSIKHGTASKDPHVYQLSARAFSYLSAYHQNQSIVVSGESGSGKTENAKRLMECLTASTSNANLADEIIRCNPILESFGNAKTVMNNNSSRFGKFTKILFDQNYNVVGAKIKTYLLEKSRIVLQDINERNYHIFYLVFEAQKHSELNFNLSSDLNSYFYLYGNGSGNVQDLSVKNRNDYDYYVELETGFDKLQFQRSDINQVYNAVACVLHLGQISFKENDKGYAQILDECHSSIENAARLLGVEINALSERLEKKTIKVGVNIIKANLNVDDAYSNRDALSKTIYHRLFLWLVLKISNRLSNSDDGDDANDAFIGILDVFGFESFKNNSFEQFCINYCNEVLQHFFNKCVIILEQEEYLREGLAWNEMEVVSNRDLVALVTNPKNGIFALLDSACQMPKGTADAFYDSVMRNHSKHKLLKKSKKRAGDGRAFIIIHYAANVDYNCCLFLHKNRDTVHSDTIKLLTNSKHNLIQSMMKNDAKRKAKQIKGVGTRFNKQLQILMHDLKKTKSWFLRCLNPNKNKSATEWNESHMKKQLQCNGIIEAIKVIKLGYPSRAEHQFILKKFSQCLSNNIDAFNGFNIRKKIQCILWGLDVNANEYELGFTKVFFRPNTKNILVDIQNHSGTFTEEQINSIKRRTALSESIVISGLLLSYLRLSREFMRKLARAKRRQYLHQMYIASKFVSSMSKRDKSVSDHDEPPQEEELELELKSDNANDEKPESSDYENDNDSSSEYSSSQYSSSEEDSGDIEKQNKRSETQKKIAMLVRAWSLNSVIGETFLKYGRKGFPHERMIQVDITGRQLLWGTGSLSIKNIKEVRPGITTEVLKKHQGLESELCLSIVLEDRTLDLKATRKGQRNVWVAALRLLSGKSKAAKLFRKMRTLHVTQQLQNKSKKAM